MKPIKEISNRNEIFGNRNSSPENVIVSAITIPEPTKPKRKSVLRTVSLASSLLLPEYAKYESDKKLLENF